MRHVSAVRKPCRLPEILFFAARIVEVHIVIGLLDGPA